MPLVIHALGEDTQTHKQMLLGKTISGVRQPQAGAPDLIITEGIIIILIVNMTK